MHISVSHLGLAAYIKMRGATLLKVENRSFIFETEHSVGHWRVEYNNSCCIRHDTLVCELRHFLKE